MTKVGTELKTLLHFLTHSVYNQQLVYGHHATAALQFHPLVHKIYGLSMPVTRQYFHGNCGLRMITLVDANVGLFIKDCIVVTFDFVI